MAGEVKLSKADFDSWRFNRNSMHLNGGKDFFGSGHQCVDQPRLVVIDKFYKKDRSSKRTYHIDGKVECATLDEALALLETPPMLSDAQRSLLARVSDDWFRPEDRFPLIELGYMGLIEWGRLENKVACRRAPAGRAALKSGEG